MKLRMLKLQNYKIGDFENFKKLQILDYAITSPNLKFNKIEAAA